MPARVQCLRRQLIRNVIPSSQIEQHGFTLNCDVLLCVIVVKRASYFGATVFVLIQSKRSLRRYRTERPTRMKGGPAAAQRHACSVRQETFNNSAASRSVRISSASPVCLLSMFSAP